MISSSNNWRGTTDFTHLFILFTSVLYKLCNSLSYYHANLNKITEYGSKCFFMKLFANFKEMETTSIKDELKWRISTVFFVWTRVLNHNKYVEIKQFSKVDIKQNNISTVILLIKFLVYQWDPRHLQGSLVVYIFVYIMKFVLYLISNHIFMSINHKDTF